MSSPDEIRDTVSASYTRAVAQTGAAESSCCSGPAPESMLATLSGYDREALAALPADAVASSFGCGNPVALAQIAAGETVLDLGSGAGIDLLLAAKLAGPGGKVIGVDMTEAMIERARQNAAAAGLENVEVRRGIIEALPVESASVDLVLSNCVINLSPEKERVFAELYRVLRPGGRFSISDIVAEPMPAWITADSQLYSACIAGAIPEEDYLEGLREAGFGEVAVADRLTYDADQLAALLGTADAGASSCCCCGPAAPSKEALQRAAEQLCGKVASVRVVGRKPEQVNRKETTMEIKVLGPGCAKCKKLYDLALAAVQQAGVEATVTKVEQLDQIATHGIVFTPGLVIDDTVVSAGKLPKVAQIAAWIEEARHR